jgi:hypothetical protein
MNWTNETTEKYAYSHPRCPINLINCSNPEIFNTKNEKIWHLSLQLRNDYLVKNKKHKSIFIEHIAREAYTSIDWNQLAEYWSEEYFSVQKEVQLQLL